MLNDYLLTFEIRIDYKDFEIIYRHEMIVGSHKSIRKVWREYRNFSPFIPFSIQQKDLSNFVLSCKKDTPTLRIISNHREQEKTTSTLKGIKEVYRGYESEMYIDDEESWKNLRSEGKIRKK